MKIQKFSEFQKSLQEAAKQPADIIWTKTPNTWIGNFVANTTDLTEPVGFKIEIEMSTRYCKKIKVWEFEFTRANKTKMFNDFKYPYIVVPTIKLAMETFLKEKRPDVIGFVGNRDDKGRIKMYEKNVKYYADKFDYHLLTNKDDEYYVFVLYDNPDFEECAEELKSYKP